MDKLLPCPFCGGKDIIMTNCESGVYALLCRAQACCTEGPWGTTKAEAIARWNTRAAIPYTQSQHNEIIRDTCPRYGADDGPDALEDV